MSPTGAPAPAWTISSRQATPHRVEATVDGVGLWVECDDAPIGDAPEAWGTAFALPSARAGAGLAFAAPVDGTWAATAKQNVELAAAWWGGEPHPTWTSPKPQWPRSMRSMRSIRSQRRRPPAGRGLCFTGGVDSFFSLLCGDHRPTHLVYVVGFDVPLDDRARTDDVVGLVRTVAEARQVAALIVRTDLRDHPRFASISWEHTHGAALAAIGHLLRPVLSTLVIPPSYAQDRLVPWGSRPDLDPGWSAPGRLVIEHGDASGRRVDRVAAIAADPLVHRHLRVCWQNVDEHRNCGRCEKCVRTMAMLAGAGALDACETFPDRAQLPDRIASMEAVPTGVIPLWRDLLATDLRAEELRSIEALVARSAT